MMISPSVAPEGQAGLKEVRMLIDKAIAGTSLSRISHRWADGLCGGKMLRARLILCVGPASMVSAPILYKAAAAVEMLQSASLLHDDVVDGGAERRGEPAFWVAEGTKAAVLLGDMLVSQAVSQVQQVLPHAISIMVETLQEMCDAEIEQEFHLSRENDPWEQCLSIARRKTGSLFGFAAYCAGGLNPPLAKALREAGYTLGTAYQLADDLLDTGNNPAAAGKTLGTDARDNKLTAATFPDFSGHDPAAYIEDLLRVSTEPLDAWPDVREAWNRFIERTVAPVVHSFTRCAETGVVS